MEIVKPEKKYLQSYYEGCAETWRHIHDSYILHDPNQFDKWKDTIFNEFKNQKNGINLPDGFVPSETFWIIENNEYAGSINIRPDLNERLKEYGGHAGCVIRMSYRNKGLAKKAVGWAINKLLELNINEIILTCEETNIISQKVLTKLSPVKCEKDIVTLNNIPTKIRRYFYNAQV